MIQHHRGAVTMVKELFGTYGAAQDETVFKFANDVSVDQSTEIARMETMLAPSPVRRKLTRATKDTRSWLSARSRAVARPRSPGHVGLLHGGAGPQAADNMSTTPPSPDPRVGLRAGLRNAAEAPGI